ncbi:MAG: hypothetical protein QOH56_924 [Pseudonocardiales bacterium]|nr:hypothetical protein [Pseudonocardiales bacterium]
MTAKELRQSRTGIRICEHRPPCPDAYAPDGLAAHVLSNHLEQGWELLCNGIVVFDDFGALLPDGRSVGAQRIIRTHADAGYLRDRPTRPHRHADQ